MARRSAAAVVEVGRDVGAIVQALRVLRVLAKSRDPLGVSAIARAADVNPSTCLNILRTLANENMVGFDPTAKLYRIEIGMLEFARPLLDQTKVELLRPYLEQIADRYGALGTVWKVTNTETLVLVDKMIPDVDVRLDIKLSSEVPIGAGAVGRAVVGALTDNEMDRMRIFNGVRWATEVDFKEFNEQVEEAKERGFAADDGQLMSGLTSLGAYISGHDGAPLFGVSFITLKGYISERNTQKMGRDLSEFCRWAERVLFGAV